MLDQRSRLSGLLDDQPGVGLLLDVDVHVGDLVGRPVAIDRRLDERVVQEQYALMRVAVPAPRVVLIGRVELALAPKVARKAAL